MDVIYTSEMDSTDDCVYPIHDSDEVELLHTEEDEWDPINNDEYSNYVYAKKPISAWRMIEEKTHQLSKNEYLTTCGDVVKDSTRFALRSSVKIGSHAVSRASLLLNEMLGSRKNHSFRQRECGRKQK
eukprot:CAMPEP_0185018796 /NCGR_PEP_ID=MMETSP1103-20130426/1466_1 /TAXON_ID=36769 /ORGANISM="Paraphysomonas bandaiensis, Strain Caron Lab Isolate" /LENGTH=127 /DNA_ID=CAMNT_0027548779 /DNA_START=36 /DNA_END=419 /DNA_ORIENTATION=-